MSQHHAPWLGCGGGVRMVNHRQQVGPQDGNLGTGPPSFSDCTRAPAHCLLLVNSIPQRSNFQCPSWIMPLCCYWLVFRLCPTLSNPMDCSPPDSSVHGDFPSKNTGVGCHFFLQGVFPTQGPNPHLLHWQVDSLPLSL